jgi:NADH-quinone oxidoreductase subunit L
MPRTYWLYLIATLALAGIFPLSGFWSKDEILGKAWLAGVDQGRIEGFLALGLLLAAAGFTAFYMWRQIEMVFHGKPRTEAARYAAESGPLMIVPLIFLGVLSVVGGLLNIPGGVNLFGWPVEILAFWLEESVTYAVGLQFNLFLAIVATVTALVGIALAWRVYRPAALTEDNRDPLEVRREFAPTFRLANARLYWDETYGRYIEQPFNRASAWLANRLDWEFWHNRFHEGVFRDGLSRLARFFATPVDRGAIDGGFNRLADGVRALGTRLRTVQGGYIRLYFLTMFVGALVVVLIVLLPLLG